MHQPQDKNPREESKTNKKGSFLTLLSTEYDLNIIETVRTKTRIQDSDHEPVTSPTRWWVLVYLDDPMKNGPWKQK